MNLIAFYQLWGPCGFYPLYCWETGFPHTENLHWRFSKQISFSQYSLEIKANSKH